MADNSDIMGRPHSQQQIPQSPNTFFSGDFVSSQNSGFNSTKNNNNNFNIDVAYESAISHT
jgi:hypothetical protein